MNTPHPDEWSGQRLDDADFSYARLHGPNFEGARITDGWLANADISAFIDGLRINGVMIAPLVTAELDRMFPDRILLRAGDPSGLAEAWTVIERVWAETVSRARAPPEALLSERVDGEWSFLETPRPSDWTAQPILDSMRSSKCGLTEWTPCRRPSGDSTRRTLSASVSHRQHRAIRPRRTHCWSACT
jgi:hypothetical protein